MGLDKKTRNCQKFETYNECVTNHYINKVLNQCGCSPSFLSLTKKVKKKMLEEFDMFDWGSIGSSPGYGIVPISW